jgi:predicted neuraminidase
MAVHEHVFGDDRGFAQCHASTLLPLPGGRILAAWFGGTGEGQPDVAIWSATRGRGGWSPPVRLAKVRNEAHWNPVLFATAPESLHLHFKVGSAIASWETWCADSEDGGRTWSRPRELVPGDRGGRGAVKNKPIALADGTWLAPASLESDERWDVFVDRSEDGGRTWHAGDLVPLDHERFPGLGVIQPSLWESEPGHVHMLVRSTCGSICRSDSEDGGRSWSPIRRTDLPNNNSGLDLVRLGDGVLALACNPVAGDWAPRTPLSLLLSFDNGATWPRRLDLESGAGEYSYPAVVAAGEDLAVTYTWRRQRIAFWRGSRSEIGARRAVLSDPAAPAR